LAAPRHNPPYGKLALGNYPQRQYGDRTASLRSLARLAEAGNPILIFPQGAHIQPEAERAGDPAAQFRPGVAHLSAALNAAVVPFGLAGTERVMPPYLEDYQGLTIAGIPVAIKRGPLAIAFGAPLTPVPGEAPTAFAARLQEASFRLARQAEQALRGS
jgi:1-acyl-sn-glycerol-3-phosphate acyltransferase